MTNHWRDIRHADLILINGANPAERTRWASSG
jgi:formate dehydrogenase major subunit